MIRNNVVSRDYVRDPGTVVFASVGIIQANVGILNLLADNKYREHW